MCKNNVERWKKMGRIDIYLEDLIEKIEYATRVLIVQKIFNDIDMTKTK